MNNVLVPVSDSPSSHDAVRRMVEEFARNPAMHIHLINVRRPLSYRAAKFVRRSLREDYEVSVPAVEALVQALREDPRVYGARLTGGGFGGAVVAVCRARAECDVGREAAVRYGERTRNPPRVLVPEIPEPDWQRGQ